MPVCLSVPLDVKSLKRSAPAVRRPARLNAHRSFYPPTPTSRSASPGSGMFAWARRGVQVGFSQARLPNIVRLQPFVTARVEPRGATVPPPAETSLDHRAVRWWQPILPGLAAEYAPFEDGWGRKRKRQMRRKQQIIAMAARRQEGNRRRGVLRDQHQKMVKQKVREVYETFARLLAKEHRERLD